MTDDLKNRGPQDQARINVREDVAWWTEKLAVSNEQLRRAVSEVGTNAEKVARFLNSSLSA